MTGVPALSRASVDRDAALREDDAALAAAWHRARVLVVDAGRVLADESGDRPRLVLVPAADAPDGDRLYLGTDADGPLFAVAGSLQPRLGTRAADLRVLGAALDDHDAGLLAHAVGLTNWHAAHPRCSRCGAPTQVVRGGSVRRCPDDGSEHFPRTDPAVIVLVTDGADRCVLGRQAVWPPGRFSTLAGFVEPGESAEQAVVREVGEEAGIAVAEVRYVASQPWPFPSSLMLGFFATCDAAACPTTVDGELDDVRWFTRDELREAAEWGRGSGLQLPGRVSIARHLIDTWLDAATG
ncbi:MAG TPA: NAD(+) diphosphatase [Mycobacteriales bacterium]|nr:NAD(+) diphosphatase [Mycobacteriales bacterium]